MRTADLGGGLDLELATDGRAVVGVRLTSQRLTGLGRFFRGKEPATLVERLPLIFSLCGTAQTVAACEALEQGLACAANPDRTALRRAAVLSETIVETLRGMVVEWAAFLNEPLDPKALLTATAAREHLLAAMLPPNAWRRVGDDSSVAIDIDAASTAIDEMASALNQIGIDNSAAGLTTVGDLESWSSEGDGLAHRAVARVLEQGTAEFGRSSYRPLTASLGDLSARLAADPDGTFQAQPEIAGQTFETGALSRMTRHPLIDAMLDEFGNGLLTRMAARIVELADLPATIGRLVETLDPAVAASLTEGFSPSPGEGAGGVDCARGRLVHWARVGDGKVIDYRILAPTEWSFHPDGALVDGLRGVQAMPEGDLKRTVRLFVAAMDPCVACHVSIA